MELITFCFVCVCFRRSRTALTVSVCGESLHCAWHAGSSGSGSSAWDKAATQGAREVSETPRDGFSEDAPFKQEFIWSFLYFFFVCFCIEIWTFKMQCIKYFFCFVFFFVKKKLYILYTNCENTMVKLNIFFQISNVLCQLCVDGTWKKYPVFWDVLCWKDFSFKLNISYL